MAVALTHRPKPLKLYMLELSQSFAGTAIVLSLKIDPDTHYFRYPIRTPYIYDSYAHLPVAFVDDWSEIFSSNQSEVESMLKRWVAELGPYYEPGSELRRKVIHVSPI